VEVGVQIMTQNGMHNVEDMLTCRIAGIFDCYGDRGAIEAPPRWNRDIGFLFCRPYDLRPVSHVWLDGNTLRWINEGPAATKHFKVYFFIHRSSQPTSQFGLTIRNTNNLIVIDDTYTVMWVTGRGVSRGERLRSGYWEHLIPAGMEDLAFIQCPVGQKAFCTDYIGRSSVDYGRRPHLSTMEWLPYVTCSPHGPSRSGSYGLQIFNGNGDPLVNLPDNAIMAIRNASSSDDANNGYNLGGLRESDNYLCLSSAVTESFYGSGRWARGASRVAHDWIQTVEIEYMIADLEDFPANGVSQYHSIMAATVF
jgi:hypothetical protein